MNKNRGTVSERSNFQANKKLIPLSHTHTGFSIKGLNADCAVAAMASEAVGREGCTLQETL